MMVFVCFLLLSQCLPIVSLKPHLDEPRLEFVVDQEVVAVALEAVAVIHDHVLIPSSASAMHETGRGGNTREVDQEVPPTARKKTPAGQQGVDDESVDQTWQASREWMMSRLIKPGRPAGSG